MGRHFKLRRRQGSRARSRSSPRWVKSQPQRWVARRARFPAGAVAIEAGRKFVTPGWALAGWRIAFWALLFGGRCLPGRERARRQIITSGVGHPRRRRRGRELRKAAAYVAALGTIHDLYLARIPGATRSRNNCFQHSFFRHLATDSLSRQ